MARSSMRRVLLLAAALAIVNAPSHARSRVDIGALERFRPIATVASVRRYEPNPTWTLASLASSAG